MLEQHKTNINLKKIATISGIIITMMIGFFMMPQQTQATCTDGTCSGPKTCYANEYSCAKSSCGAQCEINSDCTSLPRFVCSVAEGIVEYRTYTSCDTTTSCACVYTHVDNTNCTTTASYDSDGGVIYTSAGFVTDYAGCTAGETVCNTYTDYYDSCSGNVLTEYSASGTGNKDHTSAAYTCSNSDAWVSPTLYQLDGSNVLQRKKTQYTCATTTVNGHANTGYCSGADGWVDQTACGAGQYHEVTHTTIGCEDVGTGYYSPAANNLRSQCAAGRYGSTTTNSASTCNGACTAGYYCPAGSVSAAASACGGNGFYCPAGSGSATAVSSGYYSTGGTSTTRTGQTQCEAGNYCVSGVQTACPANKTSDAGSTSSSDCKWENGQSCSVDGDCYEGNCDADFDTSTKYCHATATSCADYTRGTPWERATGYELCSGDTYYKSCSSSVWGAQQNNPDTADDYCTAQGDSQGGYDLAAYCTSGASGGFTNPSCVACTGGHRATTAKNDCQTACAGSDDNCITGYYCNGSNDCVIKQDSGTSCTADNQCSSGNCDTDFGGSTKYCHATATSCASYASGTPWERANGYELCSGNSYYRSCSSSVWGAQSDNPDPANDYCTAQSDSQGGYNLADVCTSGASGGFAELGCNACTGGHRANVMKDGCLATCSTDSD
ncbi:MAG: hypothetical protein NTZ80_02500, partial [Patescibacteria group bacterium]|nr:hypothetical protein [Patescibacteria group bacterium]